MMWVIVIMKFFYFGDYLENDYIESRDKLGGYC